MNKFTKFLLILVAILVAILFLMKSYVKEKGGGIATQIGAKIGTRELDMKEYYSLAQCFETYRDLLNKKEYEKAYKMLNASYRDNTDFETYQELVRQQDASSLKLLKVVPVTSSMFQLQVRNGEQEEIYGILVDADTNTFSIFPNSFLTKKEWNEKVTHKGVSCLIKDVTVFIDKTVITVEWDNDTSEEAIVLESILQTNLDATIHQEMNLKLASREKKELEVIFDTDYEFPTQLTFTRENGKEGITYTFHLE